MGAMAWHSIGDRAFFFQFQVLSCAIDTDKNVADRVGFRGSDLGMDIIQITPFFRCVGVLSRSHH